MVTISQRRQGLLFVLVGPAGVGKNEIMKQVLPRIGNLRQLPTATTRPIRASELHGREHLFVSRLEFQKLIETNALIEWQTVHDELYGMPRATVEQAIANEEDLIADIEVLGATYLRSLYPDNSVLIFIQPPSLDELNKRMAKRGESPEQIAKRLRRVDMEMQYAPLCDYLITNEKLDEASEILYAIVLAERSHRALLNLRVERNLPRHKFVYATMVIPMFNGEVLCHDHEPHFPTSYPTHGEFPHEAALRALRNEIGITPSTDYLSKTPLDSFILPAALDTVVQEHFQQVVFIYLYAMSERIMPPEHWTWTPCREAALPQTVLDILDEQKRLMPEGLS
ncbi:MAG: guanylate kinase [Chloroflexi bacterium]|nr:guanylate kinase [Chloroflexota bacterium]